jgi:hypothetical protein
MFMEMRMKLVELIHEMFSILPFLSVEYVAYIFEESFEAVFDLIYHFDGKVLHQVNPFIIFLLNLVYSY